MGPSIVDALIRATERLSVDDDPFTPDEFCRILATEDEVEEDDAFATLLRTDPDIRAKVEDLLDREDFRKAMGRSAQVLARLVGKRQLPGPGAQIRWAANPMPSTVPRLEPKENPHAPLRLRDTDYVNLGLKKPDGEWNLDEVFSEFKEAPDKVRKILIDRITHPHRSAAKVKSLRQPLIDLLEWVQRETKGKKKAAVELLQGISRLVGAFDHLAHHQVKGVRNWEGSFTYELRMLRDAHTVSSYWKYLLRHNRVYPETTVALMRAAQMIVTLEKIYETLPDEEVFRDWKRAIRKALDHPELKPFHQRRKFVEAAVAYDNPYVFVDEAGWGSEAAKHIYFDERYARGKESDPREGQQIQARLRASGELDDILREFKELADPESGIFAELWKTNVPAAEQVTDKNKRPKRNGTGDKHPFVRQFPDGVMTNILAEMDFYCRAAMSVLSANHSFSELADEPGTIKLEAFVNPLLNAPTIVPITINLGRGKNALLLSGPNMGGKTASARSILLAVLLNQAGLPLPASSSALSIFRNIYSVFPRNEQLQEGQGYFGDILKEFVELTARAGEGDLVIIDEVPTGTDYYELVSVTVVLIEDLIRRGATVIVTGHLKKAFELIAKSTGQVPYMQTSDKSGIPDFGITEGIAKRSFGIELTRKADFPPQVTELALAYYQAIMEGGTPASLPSLDVSDNTNEAAPAQNPSGIGAAVSVLRNLYSGDLFAFPQTQERVIHYLFSSVRMAREHEETVAEIHRALGGTAASELGPPQASRTKPLLLEVRPPRIGEPADRLRVTALCVAQAANYLEDLTRFLAEPNKIDGDRSFGFEDPVYDHKKAMGKLAKLEAALCRIIDHLQRLGEEPFVSETIRVLNQSIEWVQQVRKLFADEKGRGLDKEKSGEQLFARLQPLKDNLHFLAFIKDLEERREELEKTSPSREGRILDNKALQNLQKIWQGLWGHSLGAVRSILGPLDEITGGARAVIKHGLKAPVMSDETHVFELGDAKPYSTKTGWPGDFEDPPFIEGGILQTLAIDPQKPVLVITGPNSSGKTVLMLTAYVEALAATHGFYTSGQVRISHFDQTFAFFGGSNVTWRGESYFLDVLKRYAEMLRRVTPNSLVILDELHGTDNFELAAIQLAVLHYLRHRNVTVLYNTHIRDGLKLATDRIGLDLRKTDVSFDESAFEVKPHFTVSPDPDLKSQSYGLAIARQWLTDDQHQRAVKIYRDLKEETERKAGSGRGGPVGRPTQTVSPASLGPMHVPVTPREDEQTKLRAEVTRTALKRGLRRAAGVAGRLSDGALAALSKRDRLERVLDKTGYLWAKGGLGPWGKKISPTDLLMLGLAALARSDKEVAIALQRISDQPTTGAPPQAIPVALPATTISLPTRSLLPLGH